MPLRLFCAQAMSVVPLPRNGSSTVSPTKLNSLRQRRGQRMPRASSFSWSATRISGNGCVMSSITPAPKSAQFPQTAVPDADLGVPDADLAVPDAGIGVRDADCGVSLRRRRRLPTPAPGLPDGSVGVPEVEVGVRELVAEVREVDFGVLRPRRRRFSTPAAEFIDADAGALHRLRWGQGRRRAGAGGALGGRIRRRRRWWGWPRRR